MRIATKHPWWKAVINNILLAPPEERLSSRSTDSSRNKMWLRPEQKSVTWMMDLLSKIWKAEDLVLDKGAGNLSSPKTCLQLLEHSRIIGCKKDTGFFGDSPRSLVDEYAKQAWV